MFEPFKAPSNNHQGFGQGDGAEHVTVKEFVEGVNKLFAALFGYGAPATDPTMGAAAGLLAEGVDAAHERIASLEEALTSLQMRFDAMQPPAETPAVPSVKPTTLDVPALMGSSDLDPDGKPATGLTPEPSPTALVADDAGVKKSGEGEQG